MALPRASRWRGRSRSRRQWSSRQRATSSTSRRSVRGQDGRVRSGTGAPPSRRAEIDGSGGGARIGIRGVPSPRGAVPRPRSPRGCRRGRRLGVAPRRRDRRCTRAWRGRSGGRAGPRWRAATPPCLEDRGFAAGPPFLVGARPRTPSGGRWVASGPDRRRARLVAASRAAADPGRRGAPAGGRGRAGARAGPRWRAGGAAQAAGRPTLPRRLRLRRRPALLREGCDSLWPCRAGARRPHRRARGFARAGPGAARAVTGSCGAARSGLRRCGWRVGPRGSGAAGGAAGWLDAEARCRVVRGSGLGGGGG